MRRFLKFSIVAMLMVFSAQALAEPKKTLDTPDVPDALAALADRGAQLRYLGNEHGMDGWIAIFQGQEQYYYITADKKAFVTGLMFGEDGQPVTVNQVRDLQAQGGKVLDVLAEPAPKTAEDAAPKAPDSVVSVMKTESPAEKMFAGVQASNWIRLGDESAPVIYSFIDPECPHCHDFLTDLKKDYIDKGIIQVRIIPVGFQKNSLAEASLLLASPDAEALFYKHLSGDKDALPAKEGISTQAIQKNMALMQAWKFNVTPLTVYRSKSGEIKILRGRAKDDAAILADLPRPAAPANASAVAP